MAKSGSSSEGCFSGFFGCIFKAIVVVAILLFAVDQFIDEDDLDSDDTNSGYFEDSDDANEADAGDVYGNAIDDDDDSRPVTTASKWGDGTCREISTQEFYKLVAKKGKKDVFIGEGPVVVDFWASWCGYCKQIDPYLKALAKKYKGQVQFYKVNADKNEAVTSMYGIESLPTLFFCSGNDITVVTGAHSQKEFDKMIQEML